MSEFLGPQTLLFTGLGLAVVPLVLASMTSFVKIGLVIGVLRNGFGVQGVPGRMAEFALSFALTMVIMGPVLHTSIAVVNESSKPLISENGKINTVLAGEAMSPWINFMKRHTGEKEEAFIYKLNESAATEREIPAMVEDLPAVVSAFVLSELRSGFEMGFAILLPFLVVDLIVANLLVGMGLSMVSPTLVSFPLKLLLFIATNGWTLLVRGLILSYGV